MNAFERKVVAGTEAGEHAKANVDKLMGLKDDASGEPLFAGFEAPEDGGELLNLDDGEKKSEKVEENGEKVEKDGDNAEKDGEKVEKDGESAEKDENSKEENGKDTAVDGGEKAKGVTENGDTSAAKSETDEKPSEDSEKPSDKPILPLTKYTKALDDFVAKRIQDVLEKAVDDPAVKLVLGAQEVSASEEAEESARGGSSSRKEVRNSLIFNSRGTHSAV